MQNDEVIWQVLRHKHCSYMSKITAGIFCRNPNNLTGVCNRSSCPLANSRYATIHDHDGVFYLYMKSIERPHMPNKLWERIKLPRNYVKALEIIDQNLMYWLKFLMHKAKQRLTKITQMRICMRKLSLKTREKIMTTPRKEKKKESRREEKALTAAQLEKALEKELIERLLKGVCGDIHNAHLKSFIKVMDEMEGQEDKEEVEAEVEYVEGFDEDKEVDDVEDFNGQARSDDDDIARDDEEDDSDDDEAVVVNQKRRREDSKYDLKKKEKDAKKKGRVLVEVEYEDTGSRQKATLQI